MFHARTSPTSDSAEFNACLWHRQVTGLLRPAHCGRTWNVIRQTGRMFSACGLFLSLGRATIALARCPLRSERGNCRNSHRPSSESTFVKLWREQGRSAVVSRIWVVALGAVALAASCTSGSSARPGTEGPAATPPPAPTGSASRACAPHACISLSLAGQQHRYPAEGKSRRLRGARRSVESCRLRPCPYGRGPAEARHGTERHGECPQRRQNVHHHCRPAVTGPPPPEH